MSNVEARIARSLSPPGDKPFGSGSGFRRGLAANGIRGQQRFAAHLFAGDVVSAMIAMTVTVVMIGAAWSADQMGLIGRMQTQMCVLLLLLLGINVALGLYQPNIRNPMERFRLRATAMLLFAFAGTLMWIREGPTIEELAIVPLTGV